MAYKTFETGGQVIVQDGDVVDADALAQIKGAGLLDNEMGLDDLLAATLMAVAAGAMMGAYLYLFQPAEAMGVRRLVLLGLLIVAWVAAVKVFFSLTLPDDDRLYLGYMLPVAAAPMLVASLLDGGLAVCVAALLAVVGTFGAYQMPDANSPL